MSALAERLEQAVQRGWANTAHLAELRDLLHRRAANDAEQPITVDDVIVARALDAWEQYWCGHPGLHADTERRHAMTHALQAALEQPRG